MRAAGAASGDPDSKVVLMKVFYLKVHDRKHPLLLIPDKKCLVLYEEGTFSYNSTEEEFRRAERRQQEGRELDAADRLADDVVNKGEAYWEGWAGDRYPKPTRDFQSSAMQLFDSLNITVNVTV